MKEKWQDIKLNIELLKQTMYIILYYIYIFKNLKEIKFHITNTSYC